MQANQVKIVSGTRRVVIPIVKSAVFAFLLWASAAAGAVPIPGTPVPITLQTFVVMLAALTLTWKEAAGSVIAYLAAGAAGLPVFAGGASTLALVSPSAGFLIGFLPAVIVTALLRGNSPSAEKSDSHRGFVGYVLRTLRYFGASIIGCIVVVYALGITVQSALTGLPITVIALASMGFIVGDILKAAIASLAASGLAKLW